MSSTQSLLRVADELKALEAVNPNEAFDQLEDLVDARSIQELSSILNAVYAGVTEDLEIDWNFTATQWKLGRNDVAEFFGVSPEARFKVWTLPPAGPMSPRKHALPPIYLSRYSQIITIQDL